MTSLDTCTDPQLAALATLIRGAVNYDMRNDPRFQVEDDAIAEVYGHPRPVGLLSALKLPALCIFRASESYEEFTFSKDYFVADFQFDYIADSTKHENIGTRWTSLRPIWRRLFEAVREGQHPQVYDNRELLAVAGIEMIDVKATKVRYSFAPDAKGYTYPYFSGLIRLRHVEVDPAADPALFLSLAASYQLIGAEPEEQPLIESVTYTPTGQEAKEADDNPLDADFEDEQP